MNLIKILNAIFILLLPLNLLCSLHEVAPGLRYKHITLNTPPQSIHLLIADPHKVHIKIGIANDKCASAQKTSEIAQENNAIAAINGGFFDFGRKNKIQDTIIKMLDCIGYAQYKAFPIWTLKKNHHYFSLSPIYTGALCWNNNDQIPFFGIIKTTASVHINEKEYKINDINKPHPQSPMLYSSYYDKKTPLFHEPVDEIVIQNNSITEIYGSSRGKRKIPAYGWIFVLPASSKQKIDGMRVGDHAEITIENIPQSESFLTIPWNTMDNILASTPLLVINNTIPEYLKKYTSEFYTQRHPRSAVGILKNGSWIFLVIDGRQKHSEGFTMVELAYCMQKLGCTGALNLDGGGSSTMVIQDKIINAPSGREHTLVRKERPLSNAFLICSQS